MPVPDADQSRSHSAESAGDPLAELAAVTSERQVLIALQSRPKVGCLFRLWIFVMDVWAALLYGAGLFAAGLAMISWAREVPFLKQQSGAGGFQINRWGVGVIVAVVCFALSWLQSRHARKLLERRRRKVVAARIDT